MALKLRPVDEKDADVQTSVAEYFLSRELQVQKSTQRWPRQLLLTAYQPVDWFVSVTILSKYHM